MFSKRIGKLREKMREEKIDAVVFLSAEPIDDQNIYYFTGFEQERGNSFSCLLITQEETVLILSDLDYERATGKEADKVVRKDKPLTKVLKEYIERNDVVGIVEGLMPYKVAKVFKKVKDITSIVSEIRAIKDKKEIELLRKSCEIANKGIRFIKRNVCEGMREDELALELEREVMRRGAEGMAFPTIVVSSSRSWQIHPFPSFSKQRIGRGLGYVDFGVRYRGYCSDVTVPFSIGALNKEEEKIVETVVGAYEETLKVLKPNVEVSYLFKVAEGIIRKNGFELKHGLGHGLGLNVHDFPSLIPSSKKSLERIKRNMILTIEPGVYVKGVGGCRLENDFLITSKGYEVLTKSRFFKI